jgi:hypothetical protein
VVVEATIRSCYNAAIETKQYGPAAWIESVGNTPFSVTDTEAQLFHVAMSRALQGIGMRAPEHRPQRLQDHELRGRRPLNVMTPSLELLGERVMEFDRPSHSGI